MKNLQPEFAECVSNEGLYASLKIGELYEIIRNPDAETLGGILVIDEDGEDYFYDAEMFRLL